MIKHIFDAVKLDIGIIQSRFVDIRLRISQARLNNSGCPILPRVRKLHIFWQALSGL